MLERIQENVLHVDRKGNSWVVSVEEKPDVPFKTIVVETLKSKNERSAYFCIKKSSVCLAFLLSVQLAAMHKFSLSTKKCKSNMAKMSLHFCDLLI